MPSGNLPAAEQQFLKFQAMMWQANDIANAISITFILANIMLIQGRLQEAVSAYRQSLKLAANRGASFFLGASDLYRGLSEVLCEQGDLEGAAQHLQTAQQMGRTGALTGWPHRLCVAQARMREAQGDLAGALALLDEAERQYVRNPLPERSDRGIESAGVGQAGPAGRSTILGARTEPFPGRRSQLLARIRAPHPGPRAHRPV